MTRGNSKDRELRERAAAVIPGGMFGHQSVAMLPEGYPQYFSRAKGARIWDVDGNPYVDFMCAYGPNLLGYGFEPVERAASAQQALGDTLTGPSEAMVLFSEALVSMVSHADWAMACKNGTDATTMAMVVARAHTGRKTILCAAGAYHGSAPWCTPRPTGTLPEDRAHVAYFTCNDADSLASAMKAHDGDVAAVFASPFRHDVFHDQSLPNAEYARAARRLCDEAGALLVLDEVRAGFRLSRDCSWSALGVEPDLSAWGKCLANGYPLSALLGSNSARAAAQKIFVTGSFWFSATPMAAGVETLRQIRQTDYLERIAAAGEALRTGLAAQASAHGFGLRQTGPSQMPQVLFEDDPDFRKGYGWTAACVRRGVYLHPYHNMFLSAAHEPADIALALEATDEAFRDLKRELPTLQPHPALAARLAATQPRP
jgi:glutamate-1-semialdehyde 2,1-aminomutase